MHIELSLEEPNLPASQESEQQDRPSDTKTISGSQVVCAFARIERERVQKNEPSRSQLMLVSMAAVSMVVTVYFIITLML